MTIETTDVAALAARVVASVTVPGDVSPRVELTPAASVLLATLWSKHGPLMFHQSGGCCDGSAPMCYPADDFVTSAADVLLGELDLGSGRVVPFWMSAEQFQYWRHTHLTVDVVPGRGSGFSLEAPDGVRFLIRSRLMEE
ncbi:DUF779 domain-containing protein [Agromyces sp. M3QZ16-3]|uniref:DUF779 domain-containing protein n=1 Tax=Agromyces sp. M3QZ16-3 TaxID=3447585 RepID=UPI003F692E4D